MYVSNPKRNAVKPMSSPTHPDRRRARLTQAERRARSRGALLEAAARGLSRDGYGDLVLEEVAREAGYTRGALYHQFKDKEDLALAVIEWVNENWMREVGEPAAQQAEPVGELFTLARGHAVFCRRDIARVVMALRLGVRRSRPSGGREDRADLGGRRQALRQARRGRAQGPLDPTGTTGPSDGPGVARRARGSRDRPLGMRLTTSFLPHAPSQERWGSKKPYGTAASPPSSSTPPPGRLDGPSTLCERGAMPPCRLSVRRRAAVSLHRTAAAHEERHHNTATTRRRQPRARAVSRIARPANKRIVRRRPCSRSRERATVCWRSCLSLPIRTRSARPVSCDRRTRTRGSSVHPGDVRRVNQFDDHRKCDSRNTKHNQSPLATRCSEFHNRRILSRLSPHDGSSTGDSSRLARRVQDMDDHRIAEHVLTAG